MGDLRIGTSGWSYPEGQGTWNGVFYPARAGRRPRVDELSYFAEHFDTVEVNTTFYRQPDARMCRRWLERTPADFQFSLKLFQKFTHPAMYEKTAGLAGGGERPSSVPVLTPTDIDAFRRGIDPIARSGRLGALLAQFPPSFKHSEEAGRYLDALLTSLRDYAVAVELRHRSWSDDLAATLTLLNSHGAAWVQIDEPKFRFSIRQNQLPNVTAFHYVRLHGRNASKWWMHDRAEERYDYLYGPDELRPISEAVTAARTLVKKLYLYFNNHFAAKSVANAVMIKRDLGLPVTGTYAAAFVERYPQLAGMVDVERANQPADALSLEP